MLRVCLGVATFVLCNAGDDEAAAAAPAPVPPPAPTEAAAPPDDFDKSWPVVEAQACRGEETQFSKCELAKCGKCQPVNCSLKEWSDWSSGDCTGLCERARTISEHNNECGMPCNASLVETKSGGSCHTCKTPKEVDCVWGDWSAWSACTCPCGGGQKTRDRRIITSPQGGGKMCPEKNRTEITFCNNQTCGPNCRDGEWDDWSDWGQCTHSCGGGTQLRSRVVGQTPNACGTPVTGPSQEYRPCNVEISCENATDCEFDEWSEWSDCSCTCDGVARRSRTIKKFGSGRGKWCYGPTKEIAQCNPRVDEDIPEGCGGEPPVDCVMDDWADWQKCSATCGGGQKGRIRKVKTEAKAGGAPCGGALSETTGCNTGSCNAGVEVQDCTWGDWKEWGECDKCGGERHRYRLITAMPKNAGQPCTRNASEELSNCTRACHDRKYCVWGDWSEYGDCSATCGAGYKQRKRSLTVVAGDEPDTSRLFNDLILEKEQMQNENVQEMVLAFACGAVSFVVFLSAARAIRSSNIVRRTRDLGME